MSELRIKQYLYILIVAVAGLSLYSYYYYVRQLLASLALFSVVFFSLALVVMGAFLIWWASEQVANWTLPASRTVVAFSRRLIAAYARH